MQTKLIGIRWTDPESNGYTDLLRSEWLLTPGSSKEITHDVLGPNGGLYRARCQLTVRPDFADLDYHPFAEFNLRQGVLLGLLRLHFAPTKRGLPVRVQWRSSGTKAFSATATADIVPDPLPARQKYSPQPVALQRSHRLVTERPGQVQFRATLLIAYGGRCCISGCAVTEALEGAHIDPFSGEASHHPQNGLLLRQDLHALFDSGLIGIDPETLIVYFAPQTQAWGEYAALSGKARLLEPEYGGASYRPSRDALRRRWRSFRTEHLQAERARS